MCRAFTYRSLTIEVVTRWYRAPEILLGCNTYSPVIDVWSVGCIMVEMARNKVLFEGGCDIDQLHLIFQLFGTPDETSFPGLTSMPFWRDNFPRWTRMKTLEDIAPQIPAEGLSLLRGMLEMDPSKRFKAHVALAHAYAQSRYAVAHPPSSSSSSSSS